MRIYVKCEFPSLKSPLNKGIKRDRLTPYKQAKTAKQINQLTMRSHMLNLVSLKKNSKLLLNVRHRNHKLLLSFLG